MPIASPYPPIDIPNVDLWSFLFERNDRPFPDDKIIYQDAKTSRHYTYKALKEASLDFGKGLKALHDWRKGDVLALFTPNSIDTPAVIWGTIWAGGIISPSNPAYTVDELVFQLKDAGAKMLVTQMSVLPTAVKAAEKVGIPTDRVIILGDDRDPTGYFKHYTSVCDISKLGWYRKPKGNPRDDLAFLVYSSGTTGLPKGVMLSHRNIIANILQQRASDDGHLGWDSGADGNGDRILAFLPFYHIYGLSILVTQALYIGYCLFVMTHFDIERWCAHVQNHRITFAFIVPPVAVLLAKHPVIEKFDLSSLRMMTSGAAPLTKELVEAVYSRIKVGIKQGYGLSETSPAAYQQEWQDWRTGVGSVGRLLPNMEAKYMTMPGGDSEPREVSSGEVGELYLRGPNVFLGYHQNQTATQECLSVDRWFRTGDVGYQDSQHNFYITDRVKELIKYKGFQVAPAELEGLLLGSDSVNDVAVIGIQSKESEVPMAFVVRSTKSKSSGVNEVEEAANIARWLEEKVAPHKRLRGGVHFIDQIPKNPSGKILRRVLREKFENGVTQAGKANL